jgi:hypothetical protein
VFQKGSAWREELLADLRPEGALEDEKWPRVIGSASSQILTGSIFQADSSSPSA